MSIQAKTQYIKGPVLSVVSGIYWGSWKISLMNERELLYVLLLYWFLYWPIGYSEVCCWFAHISEFSNFPIIIHSFISLCLKKTIDMISVFLKLLRLALWSNIWSILGNVSCTLEESVFSAAIVWNTLYILLG